MIATGTALPQLGSAPRSQASYSDGAQYGSGESGYIVQRDPNAGNVTYGTTGQAVTSTQPYDRTFILRQYKPIPATIVSDVRADAVLETEGKISFPVRATVDRNVYSDNGRTVIIPTGTLLMGYVTGEVPGPYKSIGRMDVRWYQFILPNGVEFNFHGDPSTDPFSADSQGRVGVPGRGSTDYLEQFVMPMLTSFVPAAVNMIAPIADRFVNQIDLDNNTVVQSGTVRSSELAKNEIITAWNQVAQKLLVDMMDNTVPPFTIPAGTRITVYSPIDLQVTCPDNVSEKCAMSKATPANETRVEWGQLRHTATKSGGGQDESWVGQVRSFNWSRYCTPDGKVNESLINEIYDQGLDYRNVLFFCQSSQYQAVNNVKADLQYQQAQQKFQDKYGTVTTTGGLWSGDNTADSLTGFTGAGATNAFYQDILGMEQDEDGYWVDPAPVAAEEATGLTCLDGSLPDANGCCAGEEYTDMGDAGFNCCPIAGGDCFPPIQ